MLAGAAPAKAVLGVPTPPTPTPQGVEALVQSFVPQRPNIIVPSVPDPNHLTFPSVPYIAPPPGTAPALGVLSPTTVLTCQVAYLGPLGGIVVMTVLMSKLGQHPVAPGFLNPVFSPAVTLCVAAPFPAVRSCGPDGMISDALSNHPALPGVGALPTVDPFADVPAPFATVVVEVGAVQNAVQHYVYDDSVQLPLEHKLQTQLNCQ